MALKISSEKKENLMKIIESFEESGLLIKGISETIKNEAKDQKGRFFSILLETVAASILGNGLSGRAAIRTGEGVLRAGQNFKFFLIL